jgi:hypothetical protein
LVIMTESAPCSAINSKISWAMLTSFRISPRSTCQSRISSASAFSEGMPNREFFAALQGIKSADQGNFRCDQGIPLSSAFGSCPADKSYRPDRSRTLPRRRTGTPPDARSRRSRSRSRGRLCPCERRPRYAADRSPSLSTRTIGVPGFHDGARLASRAARVHRARRRWGTEGSNPAPSSGESLAHGDRRGRSSTDCKPETVPRCRD